MEQAELAEKAGLARYTIIRLENGERASVRTIRRLARALRVSPETLMGRPGEGEPEGEDEAAA
jgi:transcriptional regulator with XRE-family HTH domain